MSDRILTERELNRAVLARQLLLERSTLSIPRALERICGIQNQYAPNGYIRLWSCLERFERDDLTRALERRSVIQGTLMRETIHLVSKRDYVPFAAAIRRSGQEWWRRVNKQPEVDVAPLAGRVRAFMRGQTRTRKELDAFLDDEGAKTIGIGHWVDMVRAPPSGTWDSRRAHTFALAEECVGPLEADEDAAIAHLVRRYLAAFGPAHRGDVSKFTGIPITRLKPILAGMRLRTFRDADGDELIDVTGAPLPDPETPAPVRFLPTWDALLLAHARRTGVLEERFRTIIFNTKAPQSFFPFLVDGRVAGTWKYDADRIRLEPFERLTRSGRRELRDEAERLTAFHR